MSERAVLKIFCLLLCFIWLVPALAQEEVSPAANTCLTGDDAFVRHMVAGAYALGANEARRALEEYDCAVAIDPTAGLAYLGRARTHLRLGNYQSVLIDTDIVLDILPDEKQALNFRGLALHNDGRYAEAEAIFTELLARDPEDATAYNNRGLALWRQGNTEGAIRDFERAIEIGHNPIYFPYMNLGNLYRDRDDYRNAVFHYDRAGLVDGNYAPAFKLAGDMYLELGFVDEAQRAYERYLGLVNRASEDVLVYLETVRLRQNIQRYLPAVFILAILIYFFVDAFLRWQRARRLDTSPESTISAEDVSAPAVNRSVPDDFVPDPLPQNRPRRWLAWLVLPVVAGVAVGLNTLFGRRDS